MKMLVSTSIPWFSEAFLIPITLEMKKRGWTVDLICNCETAGEFDTSHHDNIYHAGFSRKWYRFDKHILAILQVRKVLNQHEYDVVYCHNPVSSFLVRYASRKSATTKVIYMAHGFHFLSGENNKLNPYLLAEKITAPWTDRLVVINKTDQKMATQHQIIDAHNLRYVPGVGIDLQHYSPGKYLNEDVEKFRRQWNVDSDDVLFVSVAALRTLKGQPDVLRALSKLERTNWSLLLVGKGPILEECRDMCVKLGIESKVHFLGFRKDVDKILWASDVAVLASVREGLPRFVMEALAMRKIVVGSNIRGTRDLVGERDGYLYESGNVQELTKALGFAYEDIRSGDCERMKSHADKLLAKMELNSVTHLQAEIIEEVCGETK